MKKLHRIVAFMLVAITMSIGLTACNQDETIGYTVNAASVARAGAELHITYDSVAALVATSLNSYSAEEQQRLHQVHNAINALRTAVEQFDATDTTSAVVSVNDVRLLYRQAKSAYINARAIIDPKLANMPAGKRQAILRFDEQAQALDKSVATLLKTPDGRDISATVDRVISIAAIGVRMAISTGAI